jgi:hypothetical protein
MFLHVTITFRYIPIYLQLQQKKNAKQYLLLHLLSAVAEAIILS